jgi:UDPglucose--hexose-1-phosphate uridylyltransferase
LASLAVDHIESVIELWTERFRELGNNPQIKYVFIFENKGREIGTTLDHPHGQIYAFPFIPPRIRTELSSSKRYWRQHKACLFCKVIAKEKSDAIRIVSENDSFLCFLPFFAHWPYGVHVYPKRHVQALTDLTRREKERFAQVLKDILTKFDDLFNISFPYMMVLHQRPTDGKAYRHYHFHVEFYPPYRERDKIKYFASVETGAGTTTFDYSPEGKAKELRESIPSTQPT